MSVTRPESLIIINTEMEFNLRDFKKLEVDLKHINEGKDQTRETKWLIEDVLALVKVFIDGQIQIAESHFDYKDESCDYFLVTDKYKGKLYKLVFCICSDRKNSIGIITLHRIRSDKNEKI